MLTPPYSLRSDYTISAVVSTNDLNRRALVLCSQLPGALRGAALVPGVLPLFEPSAGATAAELLAGISNAAESALVVTKSGGLWNASAGAALIESASGALVYTQTGNLSTPQSTPATGTVLYIYLALQIPDDPLSVGALDSTLGDAPELLVSALDDEPNALKLASVDAAGTLTDLRQFIALVLLVQQLALLQSDLGYDATQRAKGDVATRLDTLEGPSEGGGGGSITYLSQLLYSPVDPRPALEVLEGRFADLEAADAANSTANTLFPPPLIQIGRRLAQTQTSVAELQPHFTERTESSIIVKGAGEGSNDTPNFSPTTGNPNEAVLDHATGLIGPA